MDQVTNGLAVSIAVQFLVSGANDLQEIAATYNPETDALPKLERGTNKSVAAMPDPRRKIEVGFYGALKGCGRIFLPMPATIEAGLRAAGGLAHATKTMWPAGIIRVRRRRFGRMSAFREFDMADPSGEWKRFRLQQGDLVTFQRHIVMKDRR